MAVEAEPQAAVVDDAPETAVAPQGSGYVPFSAVMADPRWENLEPDEKTKIVDNWAQGFKDYGAAQGWDGVAFNAEVDAKTKALHKQVLSKGFIKDTRDALLELPVAAAQQVAGAVEAVPRALAMGNETKSEGLARLDKVLAALEDGPGGLEMGFATKEEVQKERDALAAKDTTAIDKEILETRAKNVERANAVQDFKEGLADELNPAVHDTAVAQLSRAAGNVVPMLGGPVVGISSMLGSTYSEAADAAIAEAQDKGETDPAKLAQIGAEAGQLQVAKSLPTLAAYAVGGPLAEKAAQAIPAVKAASALVKGLVGGGTAATTNLAISGASRVVEGQIEAAKIEADPNLTPEQKAAALAALPGFIGNLEQNAMDIGFGAAGGVHAFRNAQAYEALKGHIHSQLEGIDNHPATSTKFKAQARENLLSNIQDPSMRAEIRAEYDASKAATPVKAAATQASTTSPATAKVATAVAEANEDAEIEAALKRDRAAAEKAMAEAADEVEEPPVEAPEVEEAPAPTKKNAASEPVDEERAKSFSDDDEDWVSTPYTPPAKAAAVEPIVVPEPAAPVVEPPIEPGTTAAIAEIERRNAPDTTPVIPDEPPGTKFPVPEEPVPASEPATVSTSEPAPAPAPAPEVLAPEEQARRDAVDAHIGNPANMEKLRATARKAINKNGLSLDPDELITTVWQSAPTRPSMKDAKSIDQAIWSIAKDEGDKQRAREHKEPVILDSEAPPPVESQIPESEPVAPDEAVMASEAPQSSVPMLAEFRATLDDPAEIKALDRLEERTRMAMEGTPMRGAPTKAELAIKAKLRDHVVQQTTEPTREDRAAAVDRAYTAQTLGKIDGAAYREFKERIDEAETRAELHRINQEIAQATPPRSAALQRMPVTTEQLLSVRMKYGFGEGLGHVLSRVEAVTRDPGRKAIAQLLQHKGDPNFPIRLNSSLHMQGSDGWIDRKRIDINPYMTDARIEEVILHEGVHQVTLDKIDQYLDNDARLTPAEYTAIHNLELLRQKALKFAPREVRKVQHIMGGPTVEAKFAEIDAQHHFLYGLSSLPEFATEMLTHKPFQQWLREHKVEFHGETKSAWEHAIEFVRQLFGAKPGDMLHQGLRHVMELIMEREPVRVESNRRMGKIAQDENIAETPDKFTLTRRVASPARLDPAVATALESKANLLKEAGLTRDVEQKLSKGSKNADLAKLAHNYFLRPDAQLRGLAEVLHEDGGLSQSHAEAIERSISKAIKANTPDPGASSAGLLGAMPTNPFRPKALAQDIPKASVPTASDPAVEARWQGAKLHQKPWWRKAADSYTKGLHWFRRHFEHLDPATDGAEMDILRRAESIPDRAQFIAGNAIREVTDGLGPNKYEVFNRVLILRDLKKDIDRGLYDSKDLPFGYADGAAVEADLNKFETAAAKDSSVTDAIAKRQKMIHAVRDELVARKLLPEAVQDFDDYFHRQVLEYYNLQDSISSGTSRQDARVGKKGYQKKRTGSAKDFNTNYIEAEFEVLAQAHSQIEMQKALTQLRSVADITPQLKAQADNLGVEWKSLIPRDHTLWQPEKGNYFYRGNTLADRVLEEFLKGTRILEEKDFKNAVLLGGKRQQWVIPKRLASTLENMGPTPDNVAGKLAAAGINTWKKWILLNPPHVLKYNLNNFSGDLDIVMAYNPKIMKEAADALRDANRLRRGRQNIKDIDDLRRLDVVGSGFSVQEVPDIGNQDWAKTLRGEQPNLLQRYWKNTKDFTQMREDILRIASYRHFLKEINKGKQVYGASSKAEIDAISDPKERAAKLARELLGDYGNISVAGQYIRGHIIPFYSWMEINAPRYVRLMRNLPDENRSTAKAAITKTALKASSLAIKATTMYMAVNLWNKALFPDEEAEMSDAERGQLHLILGRTSEGKIRSLRFQGALSDALSWFGAENLPQDIAEIRNGKATVMAKIGDAIKAPFAKLITGAVPLVKAVGETIAGQTSYPDPFHPRPVRDRIEHAARTLSLDSLYRWVAGKPHQPALQDAMSLLTYVTDPGEAAYFAARGMVQDYMQKQGVDAPSIAPTAKSNALYYYKQAIRYGDTEAAAKFLQKYKDAGGNEEGLESSIDKSAPLNGLIWKGRDRQSEFLKSLSPEDQAVIKRAIMWHNKVYRGASDTKKKTAQVTFPFPAQPTYGGQPLESFLPSGRGPAGSLLPISGPLLPSEFIRDSDYALA